MTKRTRRPRLGAIVKTPAGWRSTRTVIGDALVPVVIVLPALSTLALVAVAAGILLGIIAWE
jgi:hypothetical protein